MLIRTAIVCAVTAGLMVVVAGPTMAKKKPKQTEEATSAIIPQPKCTAMKTMHWDDATQTCQKNK
jgi:energy-converting hydrogenase Eha subunit A